ncbi:MAG: NADP-dependent oxidoreductase [Burkholderiaceae bacterium]
MTSTHRQWRLRRRPVGDIGPDDLELVTVPKPVPGPGQILVRTIYLSLDPTNRIWMSDRPQYMPPVAIGDVMRGGVVGVVERSNHPGFAAGDYVRPAVGGWQEYVVADAAQKLKVDDAVPLLAHMSAMGMTGATAYFGLLDIGRPQPGETVVISAAAGAVGSIAGQIAKLKGCRAVGLAGSDDKCRWVTGELGFDACINYKTEDVGAALSRECPSGIDVDFENVGGPILDEVLARINLNARVVLCGLISTYNDDGPVPGPYQFSMILMRRALVKGFIVSDYAARFREFYADMGQWLAQGKIRWRADVVDGIENAATAVNRLFTGANTGKLVVKVGEER